MSGNLPYVKADLDAAADEELKAALEKAVGILLDPDRMCVDGHPVSAFNLARMTLAELKGQGDE